MMKKVIVVVCAGWLMGCGVFDRSGDSSGTNNNCAENSSEATFLVTFKAAWTSASHPTDYPSGAHFSRIIGASHSSGYQMWAEGKTASSGMEEMAETGGTTTLKTEIEEQIQQGLAKSAIEADASNIPASGDTTLSFTTDANHAYLSLATMLAPSPDWFVGIQDVALCMAGDWISSTSIDLQPMDAGTDDGSTFVATNADTDPKQNIAQITDAPFSGTPALGQMVIERQ